MSLSVTKNGPRIKINNDMKISFKHTLQIILALLGLSVSCNQASNAPQETPKGEDAQGILFRPLEIISGVAYEEKLLVAIDQATQKMGLYRSTEEEILPVIYDEIFSGFVNPFYVVVVQNKLQGLFDVRGKRICESIYSGFTLCPSDASVIAAYLGPQEKWKIIDNEGVNIFPGEYTRVEFLDKGLVILRNDEYKCSLASIKGQLLTTFGFELLQGLDTNETNQQWYIDNDIVATARVDLNKIFINSKGEVINKQ